MLGPRVAFRVGPRAGSAVAPVDDELRATTLIAILVTPSNPSIAVLGTVQMTATGVYSDNTQRNITATVTWSTVSGTIATVGVGGLVAGVLAGTTQVRATLSGVTGQTNVTVL